jgi:hypothetical protein
VALRSFPYHRSVGSCESNRSLDACLRVERVDAGLCGSDVFFDSAAAGPDRAHYFVAVGERDPTAVDDEPAVVVGFDPV